MNIIDLDSDVILALNQELFRVWFDYVEILRRSRLTILIKAVQYIVCLVSTFLLLIFPAGLLNLRVFWHIVSLLVLLVELQQTENILARFPQFMFEHGGAGPGLVWPDQSDTQCWTDCRVSGVAPRLHGSTASCST